MRTLHVLKARGLQWHLFAIDDRALACHYICIDGNEVLLKQDMSIEEGRLRWLHLRRQDFTIPKTQSDVLGETVTSHLGQRLKEFVKWQTSKKITNIINPPFEGKAIEIDSAESLQRISTFLHVEERNDYEAWLQGRREKEYFHDLNVKERDECEAWLREQREKEDFCDF